jgi:putative Mn2+ efflux pump MntP
MNFLEICSLSLALAVDVFGIAFAYGLIIKRHRIFMMLRLAFVCGIMQAAMPTIGYFGTSVVSEFISSFDYILVFLVFSALGINILREALKSADLTVKRKSLTLQTTLAIGVATSIDALVSGSMIYLTKTPLLLAVFIIGLGSFMLGIIGFNLNCCLKRVPEKNLQIIAGLTLIALGAKSLILHFF